MKVFKLIGYYPGGTFLKRIKSLLFVFCFPVIFLLNNIQDQLFQAGMQFADTSVGLAQSAVSSASFLGRTIAPQLDDFQRSEYSWIINDYNLPTSQDIKDGLYRLKDYQGKLARLETLLKLTSYILWLTSLLLIISTASNLLWLLCDWYYGPRFFTGFMLICALVFNGTVYYFWHYRDLESIIF